MPTSNSMPDVSVQIAFNGGFRVPMTSWTWTDVSTYVELAEGISINWGRGDERSTADANTLTVTFDNSDGRFTAERTGSPYSPNVKLYKPIRVLATPVDGAQQTLFTGYVTSWPTEWEGTSAYAKATITASSRLARLGLNAAMRSIIEENYLLDSPVAYYPLGEPEGATRANDASGNGAAPLMMVGAGTAVVFGTAIGPGTDDLTAAQFAAGQWLSGPTPAALTAATVEAFFLSSTLPAFATTPVVAAVGNFRIVQTATGAVAATVADTTLVTSGNVTNGLTHHVAATWSGTTVTLYVDGVSVGSAASTGVATGPIVTGGFSGTSVAPLIGVVAHVAAYPTALTAARVLAHATAGSTAWAGELTSVRFVNYGGLAAIPAAEISAATGSTAMVHVDTTGKNHVEMLRIVETTEGGVLFDSRDGVLTMHNRAHRYARSATVTLDMAKQEVEADYSPRLDPSALANDITAANVAGTFSAHIKDTASILDNGSATLSYTTASQDDDEPLQLASWAKLKYATPRSRVPSLSVDALAQVGKTVNCAAVMAVTIGDKVTVTNHPSQAATTNRDYFVEGGTFSIGPERFEITWNVSPSSPDDMALIVGDATRGVVGTNYVAL